MERKRIIILACFTLWLTIFIIMPVSGQDEKKAIIIFTKDNLTSEKDTARIRYKSSTEELEYKEVSQVFGYGLPAIFEIRLTGPTGVVRASVKGEIVKNLPLAYIENSDTVIINSSSSGKEKKVSFSRQSDSKFQLQGLLDSVSFWGQYPINHSKFEKRLPTNLMTILYRFGLVRKEKIKLLEDFRGQISNWLYTYYKAEIDGKFLANSCGVSRDFLIESNYEEKLLPLITDLLNFPLNMEKEDARLSSEEFLRAIQERIKLVYTFNYKRPPQIRELYDLLKASLAGRLREKIIYRYLKSEPKGDAGDFTACLEDALKLLTDKNEKELLINILESRGAGKMSYDFNLPDNNGKMVKLSHLRGKIVLLDFWYTGCPGCLQLSAYMEREVVPHVKQNKDFTYVTINIDKDKKKWIKSISEGRYTTSEYINLNTDGKGEEHLAIRTYKVTSYPTQVLIGRDGKIIHSNMDRQKILENIISALTRK